MLVENQTTSDYCFWAGETIKTYAREHHGLNVSTGPTQAYSSKLQSACARSTLTKAIKFWTPEKQASINGVTLALLEKELANGFMRATSELDLSVSYWESFKKFLQKTWNYITESVDWATGNKYRKAFKST